MEQLLEAFPNDLKFVYKNFPLSFHKQALPAAKAAVAAGKQGKFWEMHDIVFEKMRELSDEKYPIWAGELGLDVEKFKADFASPETAALIAAEQKSGQAAGVRGTPTFFINGRKPSGRSFEAFKAMIEEEIAKKKAS